MSASAIPGLVTPAATELTQLDDGGRMRLVLVIAGMQMVLEGHAVVIEPQVTRFFDLAERLVQHNMDTAQRALAIQEQALLLKAAGNANGTPH